MAIGQRYQLYSPAFYPVINQGLFVLELLPGSLIKRASMDFIYTACIIIPLLCIGPNPQVMLAGVDWYTSHIGIGLTYVSFCKLLFDGVIHVIGVPVSRTAYFFPSAICCSVSHHH